MQLAELVQVIQILNQQRWTSLTLIFIFVKRSIIFALYVACQLCRHFFSCPLLISNFDLPIRQYWVLNVNFDKYQTRIYDVFKLDSFIPNNTLLNCFQNCSISIFGSSGIVYIFIKQHLSSSWKLWTFERMYDHF